MAALWEVSIDLWFPRVERQMDLTDLIVKLEFETYEVKKAIIFYSQPPVSEYDAEKILELRKEYTRQVKRNLAKTLQRIALETKIGRTRFDLAKWQPWSLRWDVERTDKIIAVAPMLDEVWALMYEKNEIASSAIVTHLPLEEYAVLAQAQDLLVQEKKTAIYEKITEV